MSNKHVEEAQLFSRPDAYSKLSRADQPGLSDDDEGFEDGRTSSELAHNDHDILAEEDEREQLLLGRGGSNKDKNEGQVKIGKRERRKLKRAARRERRRHGAQGEDSALMYEMEEGVGSSDSGLSRHSSESDEKRLAGVSAQRKSRRGRICRRVCIHISIVILFVIILFVAYRASKRSRLRSTANLLSNGTSMFAPTTILISLDGFRADFLYRDLTPTLNRFIQNGISPKYMLPSFPSVTFPNHYTMVTGLYPEAHGIVGNTFWDPSLKKEFFYTDAGRSLQPFWWGGEPIWLTAEKQGVRTAIHMWPGSEAHIGSIEPAHVDKYNGSEMLPLKVDRILGLIDLPGPDSPAAKADLPRPQLIAAYVPNVDADGHLYGPNSTEIRQTIRNADSMLEGILQGIQERNLTDIVNIVVVSDHGMATTDVERLIQLEDLVDPDELEHVDGWPLYGLRPKNPDDLDRLHQQLLDKAKDNPNIEIYLRDKDMPERYHFTQNERIAPLWIVPKTGWAIVTKEEFDIEEAKQNGDVYHPRGLHGYDFEHPLMRAIFVARGPAFPHKPNSRVEPFQNIELYNIVCDSIGISPAPNNGTLRLPLKPLGLHSDPETPLNETPPDPVDSAANVVTSTTIPTSASLTSATSGPEEEAPSTPASVMPSATSPLSKAPSQSPAPNSPSWWEWVTGKVEDIEEWVDEFINSHAEKPPNGGHGGGKA